MPGKTQSKKVNKRGKKVSAEALTPIIIFPDVAISNQTSGTIIRKNLNANFPNRCVSGRVMEVSGFAQTQATGQLTFRLTSFLCPAGEVFSLPINVVATPIFEKPFFMTVKHTLIAGGADVEITVFSWGANGAPAAKVPFNWRCRVERV